MGSIEGGLFEAAVVVWIIDERVDEQWQGAQILTQLPLEAVESMAKEEKVIIGRINRRQMPSGGSQWKVSCRREEKENFRLQLFDWREDKDVDHQRRHRADLLVTRLKGQAGSQSTKRCDTRSVITRPQRAAVN